MMQVLALHLLVEVARGPASFWAAYLRQLPRMYTCLSYFTAADKAALQARPRSSQPCSCPLTHLHRDRAARKPCMNPVCRIPVECVRRRGAGADETLHEP